MALQHWALPQLSNLLPLEEGELKQIIAYTDTLPDAEAAKHLENLLGDSPQALEFIASFNAHRSNSKATVPKPAESSHNNFEPPPYPPPSKSNQAHESTDTKQIFDDGKRAVNDDSARTNGGSDSMQPRDSRDVKNGSDSMFNPASGNQDAGHGSTSTTNNNNQPPAYAPPPNPPPSNAISSSNNNQAAGFAPPSNPPPSNGASRSAARNHTNAVIDAAKIRARDEQEMQNLLQTLQFQYKIYNSEIEPEHDVDYYCNCAIHQYQRRKWARTRVQDMWSNAVMYPGEKSYNDNNLAGSIFSSNPYQFRVISPYGQFRSTWGSQRPIPRYHAQSIHQTIQLNNALNREAQAAVEANEPKVHIWDDEALNNAVSNLALGDKKQPLEKSPSETRPNDVSATSSTSVEKPAKSSKLTSFRKSIGIKSSEERAVTKVEKMVDKGKGLRNAILAEEQGRWPDDQWRYIVAVYQEKVGMTNKIADLRARYPIQYLHLLRAGYFEPIPVAWANSVSNPLKFTIEASVGWRGITPAWRGYEDTAEERLYWVLNHREGSVGMRMKPDFISEMNMARARMATAVEPPPQYYSATDTCHVQHTSTGYSKQVMPSVFRPVDRPETPEDDTMILLDVSGSMDFDPVRPIYNEYLITGYSRSTQPKNKDVAKAIIRRFTDAMANHDHEFRGYDLTTFSSQANYIGTINHQNLDTMWRKVRLGGGTRVMTGWQKVKELHFEKHSESATHHPIYGWQAGPQTPILRLLLLLDGEATDMDEFELDLLGLSWAHVTIFLIGVDGCPHHHRHANELQRISDVNHHVSFVDAQGNTPERFVTHELLKRHLGYEISMEEFESMEELPPYSA